MKTLMDHVQEFVFDTANETLKRFTPEQAETLRKDIEINCNVSCEIKVLQAAISDVLGAFFEAFFYDIWEGEGEE